MRAPSPGDQQVAASAPCWCTGTLSQKKCFVDFGKKKKNSSLEVGAPPRVTPAVLTEFHAIGGEEVGLGVEVSWRISGPLIP